jgi:hypothetical protein
MRKMNIQYSKKSWFNNIQVANVQSYIDRRCFIKFNEHSFVLLNLTHLTIKLNNWFDEGTSENHSTIQFGYISETNPNCQNIKQLFTLPIPKSGTGSYDVLKSNLNKVLDISDKIMKQFHLKLSVKSDEQLITLEIDQNIRITEIDFIKVATPVLKQLGLFN